jgi:hypothetical protein
MSERVRLPAVIAAISLLGLSHESAANEATYQFSTSPSVTATVSGTAETITGSFVFDTSTDSEVSAQFSLAGNPGPYTGDYSYGPASCRWSLTMRSYSRKLHLRCQQPRLCDHIPIRVPT